MLASGRPNRGIKLSSLDGLEKEEQPEILPFTFPLEVKEGQPLQVGCTVMAGDDPITLQWYKDEMPLQSSSEFMINSITSRMNMLIIQGATSEHSGMYSCKAFNPVGQTGYSAVLEVLEKPDILPFDFPSEVQEGQLLQVSCTVTRGDDPVTVQWYKDEKPLSSSPQFMINNVVPRMSQLILQGVGSEHSGTFTCRAFNRIGEASFSDDLRVKEKPEILPFNFPKEVQEGQLLQVSCTVTTGDDPVTLQWYKDEIPITSSPKFMINKVDSRMNFLILRDVSAEHTGTYSCLAFNPFGQQRSSGQLWVNVPPRIIPFHFEEHIRAGSLVQVICVVGEGDSPIDIRWTLHGEEVRPKLGIFTQRVGERTSILSIDQVGSEHRGSYTCLASNHAGRTNHTETLWVNEPPEIRPFQFEPELLSGSDTQLQCYIIQGDPPLHIAWYFHGQEVSHVMGVSTMKLGSKSSILNIEHVTHGHAGDYTCVATNRAGEARYSATLVVHATIQFAEPPRIRPFSFEGELTSGKDTQITCYVTDGDTPLTIRWYFHGQDVSHIMGVSTVKLGSRSSILSIEHVTHGHSGVYTCVASNMAEPPLIVPFDFGGMDLFEGGIATATCVVSQGVLPMTITWTFNSGFLQSDDTRKIHSFGGRMSILTIEPLSDFHRGLYGCSASNRAGHDKIEAELIVQEPPLLMPVNFGEFEVYEGDSVQASCMARKGDLPMTFLWRFQGALVTPSTIVRIVNLGLRNSLLSISSVEAHHQGIYICEVTNAAGTAQYATDLKVNEPPQTFPIDFGSDTFYEGDFAQANCVLRKGDLPVMFQWTFNEMSLLASDSVEILNVGGRTSLLTINPVRGHHQGNFSCIATNAAGSTRMGASIIVNGICCIGSIWIINTISKSWSSPVDFLKDYYFFLVMCWFSFSSSTLCQTNLLITNNCYITEPPQLTPVDFGELTFFEGDLAHATCVLRKGDLPIKLTWMFDGKELFDSDDIQILNVGRKTSILTLDPVQAYHQGTYSCSARNDAGTDLVETQLVINGTEVI
ncbi:hypothetical protein SK128_024055 [Halocaridina rubra]|uniref:Ig-like domain-containing protein n=1 Tax=Halocaridina rubra TaxID=373956 RepID=A0AAN8WWP0_HALRR